MVKFLFLKFTFSENLRPPLKIQWGYDLGWFFVSTKSDSRAFTFNFHPEIIWQDQDLDIAVMKVPDEVLDACSCTGYDPEAYSDGPARLIGYPITARRTYPNTSRLVIATAQLFGFVTQMESSGRVWRAGAEYVSDIDVISGNSGGAVINDRGHVIGVLHTMKTWYGEGYRHENPSLNLIPVDTLIAALAKVK